MDIQKIWHHDRPSEMVFLLENVSHGNDYHIDLYSGTLENHGGGVVEKGNLMSTYCIEKYMRAGEHYLPTKITSIKKMTDNEVCVRHQKKMSELTGSHWEFPEWFCQNSFADENPQYIVTYSTV